jgi:hypothetical protein
MAHGTPNRGGQKNQSQPGRGFHRGDIRIAIARNAGFIAHCFGNGLPQGDSNVFHGVVIVNVGIAFGDDLEVNHAVTGDLIEHVV